LSAAAESFGATFFGFSVLLLLAPTVVLLIGCLVIFAF
jgi:hypothetical protein